MNRSTEVEVKVGIFVSIGVALLMLTILLVGRGTSIFDKTVTYHSRFQQIEGLVEGATVKMSGVKIGQVTDIQFIHGSRDVDVYFTLSAKYRDAIRQDTVVATQTQGMLGDRFLVLTTGAANSPVLPPGSSLPSEPPKDLKDYLHSADSVLAGLKDSLEGIRSVVNNFNRENRSEQFFKNMTAFSANASDGTKNLRESMAHLNSILDKVDRGEGTLGSLINDSSLYDDMKALIGGANRNKVLKYFVRKSVEESRAARKNENTTNP